MIVWCVRDNLETPNPVKCLFVWTSLLCSVAGAILSGLGVIDSDACVNQLLAGVFGALLTGVGIIFAAVASF